MGELSYSDDLLRKLFGEVKTSALVGASPRGETRASWRVMRYLQNEGYKVYPVNPDALGQEIHGEKVYASVADLPEKVDMVDIFRLPWKVAPVVNEAIGATVIMDRCPAIELPRLQAAA